MPYLQLFYPFYNALKLKLFCDFVAKFFLFSISDFYIALQMGGSKAGYKDGTRLVNSKPFQDFSNTELFNFQP